MGVYKGIDDQRVGFTVFDGGGIDENSQEAQELREEYLGEWESCHWILRICQSRAAISISMNRNLGENRAAKSVP